MTAMCDGSGQFPALSIPPKIAYMDAGLDFAQRVSAVHGFDALAQNQIRLALEEILVFLIQHALKGQKDASVLLTFETLAHGLLIRINEKGLPLDTKNMPAFSPENLKTDMESDELDGLSLFLARSVMDTVVFKNRGRNGTEIELFKQLPGKHIATQVAPPAATGQEPKVAAAACPPPAHTIRPALESESIEISRCAFLVYGYSYEDYIYYPERITELNRSGELRSLVVVTDDGVVMGHCALKFWDGRTDQGELGVLFVKPEYRRQRLGAHLWRAIVERARENGLQSIFARSVTGHSASQSLAHENGFVDCALLLALFPREVELKALGGQVPGKMSSMLQYAQLKPPRHRIVYPPERYRAIVETLYHHAQIPFTTNSSAIAEPANREPCVQIQRVPVMNIARIDIQSIGHQPERAWAWTQGCVRRLCGEKMDAIYLSIHLEDPAAASFAEDCANAGFIFAGIAPDAFVGADALIMQYLNLAEDPFAQLTVCTDTASLLRDFILNDRKRLNTSLGERPS
ncbi:MAG: GNAT family N-acetyltransferase [Desulfatitalea sp.]|nr:GNAT family N-acetyltransferase [Desulfatitalea sp.]